MEILLVIAIFLQATLRMATPIALGALSANLSERAGVINIGIEGIMLMGAFCGAAVSHLLGNPWLGLIAGILAGALMGAFLGLLSIYVMGDQIVIGIGMNILGLGASTLGLILVWGNRGTSGWIPELPNISVPWLENIPVLGTILNGHDPTAYICWAVVLIAFFILCSICMLLFSSYS